MTYSEYPNDHTAQRILYELQQHSTINGETYNNSFVSTEHPEFTTDHDPDVLLQPQALTMYWPGGNPQGDGEFETIMMPDLSGEGVADAEIASNMTVIRSAILSASIGAATMNRISEEIQQGWKALKDGLPLLTPPILYAKEQCLVNGLPLALCQTSRVMHDAVTPSDKRIMHLWYPTYVSPKPVLASLKQVLRHVIDNETI